jgi:pimeloyl-ACP methyl ester carboxylesterase
VTTSVSRSGRPSNRRLVAFAAAAAVLALLLSGCVTWFQPPRPASTVSKPTGEKVEAALEPFYSQVLRWHACAGGFQCATAKAPMNWAEPGRASIDLALIRHTASGAPLGSLLVNPGGPGASGVDFVKESLSYAVDSKLQQHYDIVGFDPRGVGGSSAVDCGGATVLDQFIYGIVPGTPGSDSWIANAEAENGQFGQSCLDHTGPLLQYVDTVSAARDLDLLRAVLGDKKLNYLGYSYGTFLGATYADLYPKKTGRLVLDGALDPATTDFDVTLTQAKGFESAFRAYLKDCIGQKDCPFHGSVDQAMDDTHQILQQLQAHPIAGSDGRELGANTMFTAIILPLYNRDNWSYLNQLFADVKKGGTSVAFQLADSYNDRSSSGTYSSNETEAFTAINCLDYANDANVDDMRRQAAELAQQAPVFGPVMSWGGTSCAKWPFTGTRDRAAIHADGSAPILVVGTTNDPATPYVWAQNLAKELQNGHLVTRKGEGHTGYNKGNSCVDSAVDDFFVDGKVPASDPKC